MRRALSRRGSVRASSAARDLVDFFACAFDQAELAASVLVHFPCVTGALYRNGAIRYQINPAQDCPEMRARIQAALAAATERK